MSEFTHIDAQGSARMVDVSGKEITLRRAVALARVLVNPDTLSMIQRGAAKKGDVLAAARIAGIQGAKKTSELVPLCHNIPLDSVEIALELNAEAGSVDIVCTAVCRWVTGCEMEALCGASCAALCVYDMCKSAQRDIEITEIRLLEKSGGKSGHFDGRTRFI